MKVSHWTVVQWDFDGQSFETQCIDRMGNTVTVHCFPMMSKPEGEIHRKCSLHDGARLQRNDRCAAAPGSTNAFFGELPTDTAALGEGRYRYPPYDRPARLEHILAWPPGRDVLHRAEDFVPV